MQFFRGTEIDIRSGPGLWPLDPVQRTAAADHWRTATADNPYLWDGRILGLSAPGGGFPVVENGAFRAVALEDAYSIFIYWRHRGFPPIGIGYAFTWALIVSSDNALIYGVMAGHTANAGRVYPPGGALEPRDRLADGRINVTGCVEMELVEETGLQPDRAEKSEMFVLLDEPGVSFGRAYRFAKPADRLVARIRANLDQQEYRELADVVAIRSVADAKAACAVPYAMAIAEAFFGGQFSPASG